MATVATNTSAVNAAIDEVPEGTALDADALTGVLAMGELLSQNIETHGATSGSYDVVFTDPTALAAAAQLQTPRQRILVQL